MSDDRRIGGEEFSDNRSDESLIPPIIEGGDESRNIIFPQRIEGERTIFSESLRKIKRPLESQHLYGLHGELREEQTGPDLARYLTWDKISGPIRRAHVETMLEHLRSGDPDRIEAVKNHLRVTVDQPYSCGWNCTNEILDLLVEYQQAAKAAEPPPEAESP